MPFFTSKNYNPKGKWRDEPVTRFQLEKLEKLEVKGKKPQTKGEASDLIGKHTSPDKEEVAFLKFFDVEIPDNMTSLDARRLIYVIRSTRGARKKWGTRPADKHQRDYIRLVDGKVTRGLQYDQAKKLIQSYDTDPSRAARLAEIEAEEEAREEAELAKEDWEYEIQGVQEDINSDPSFFGLRKKLTRKEIREAVIFLESIEKSGKLDILASADKIARYHLKRFPEKANHEGLDAIAFQPKGYSKADADKMFSVAMEVIHTPSEKQKKRDKKINESENWGVHKQIRQEEQEEQKLLETIVGWGILLFILVIIFL